MPLFLIEREFAEQLDLTRDGAPRSSSSTTTSA